MHLRRVVMFHVQTIIEEKCVVEPSVMALRAVCVLVVAVQPAKNQRASEARKQCIHHERRIPNEGYSPDGDHENGLVQQFARTAESPSHTRVMRQMAISPKLLRDAGDRGKVEGETPVQSR